jgi:hypothetical protein
MSDNKGYLKLLEPLTSGVPCLSTDGRTRLDSFTLNSEFITGARAGYQAWLRGPHQPVVRGDNGNVSPLSGGVHAPDARAEAARRGKREEDRHHGGQPQRGHSQIRHQKVSDCDPVAQR